MPRNLSMPMKILDELVAGIEKVEQRLDQMGDSFGSADSIAKRSTIKFSVKKEWSTNDMVRFCQAVSTLYGIFLVQSESEGDEDCERLLLEWDKSVDIVLAYRESNDPHYTDGNLIIEKMDLHSGGLISLRGWNEPIDRLRKVIGEVSRRDSMKKQAIAAKRSLPIESLNAAERGRLVAIVQSCVADLDKLGVVVC